VPQQILNLFPLEEPTRKENVQENEADPTSERLKRMGESLVWQKPVAAEEGPEIHRAGNFYRYYRSVDSLPGRARTFYDKAGKFNMLYF
jgi:hypothetical protein